MEIQENKLNIKYGINGTGKSTVANAIKANIILDLNKFRPYMSDEEIIPTITYDGKPIKNILIYNEDYVNQYLFISQENIHENAFELFVKVPDYDNKIAKINKELDKIKVKINSNENVGKLILTYEKIDKEIKITTKSVLGNQGVVKALVNGNKTINIPDTIKQYTPFLQSNLKVSWYDWYRQGFEFYNDLCPFCGSKKKLLIKDKVLIDTLFIKKDVSHIVTTNQLINDIKHMLNKEKITVLNNIINCADQLNETSKQELLNFKLEFMNVYNKLQFMKNLNYSSINRLESIDQKLGEMIFDVDELSYFVNDETEALFSEINASIVEVQKNINTIQKETGILNSEIKMYINSNENKINEFLKSVGMDYEVEIARDTIKLKYINSDIIVEPKTSLSWGEKNCFALSLFLFDCLANNPDLIILDDPVSSFDNNKKYGIMHYLFKGERSLKNKMVLLFSHDIEPIINFYKKDRTIPKNVVAYCLSNHDSVVEEKIITNDKLRSIIEQCEEVAKNPNSYILSRLISCRKLFELKRSTENGYNILSSLFHNNPAITKLTGEELNEEDVKKGEKQIFEYINDFNYVDLRKKFNDLKSMKEFYYNAENNYEKLEIFRIINKYFEINGKDQNIMKFINETYHIENSFLYQLDPYEYDCVPNYIIKFCDEIVNGL